MQLSSDFLKKLNATFLVEAREHLQALGSGLLALGKAAGRDEQASLVETLFREAHSLKGAARSVNALEVEGLCQTLEGAFAELKSGTREPAADVLDGLHQAVNAIDRQLAESGGKKSTPPQEAPSNLPHSDFRAPASGVQQAASRNFQSDTVRIAASKLDAVFLQVEELLGVKLAWAERTLELRALADLAAEHDRLWAGSLRLIREAQTGAARQSAEAVDVPTELSTRLLALFDQNREHAEALSSSIADFARTLATDRRRFDTQLNRLLEDMKQTLMLPCETLLAGFPKMVHDMAIDVGKEVDFQMQGSEIEIDKRILEKIKEPLLHLVRNCVDHGIESPTERARRGKPPSGTVTLTVSQASGRVEITVADDGAGIDVAAVKAAAVQAGVLTAEEAATLLDQDAVQLAFESGVSTSRQVTTLSGRGLGTAIVEDSVIALGGTVRIESAAEKGTTVRIVLPLTLATLRGTLVHAAGRDFVIPTANVVRVIRVARTSVRRVENRDSLYLDGVTLSLVRLSDVLGLACVESADNASAPLTVLILGYGQACIAFSVDQVVGEQEVLAKPLGRLLPRVWNLSGATVLGTGRVVPILSVPDLLQSAAGCAQTARPEETPDAAAEASRVRRLLVVDDSITARTLLQNILEASGYSVKTASDGVAAFVALENEPFDLVVSDVEMPRLDGFGLAKRIRADPRLSALPVVLVTAREAKEDRERGIDAGANAYIVKSNFDQSHLLDVIGRLI